MSSLPFNVVALVFVVVVVVAASLSLWARIFSKCFIADTYNLCALAFRGRRMRDGRQS